jgi:uncharacterized repeat protein (TIGR01451 family)
LTSVNGIGGNFLEIVRWGQNGLALNTSAQIYVLQSPVVKDLSSSPADLSVSLSAPQSATTGEAITYTATIQNQGPNAAQGIDFVSSLPDSVILNSVTPSAGTCGSGSEVSCDLGSLNSGASATVSFNITPTTSGSIESTASVSSVSYDPTGSNNQASASVVVSGNLYSAVPVLSAISPPLVQVGSGTFTLTLSGSGFNASSTVNVGRSALATTYVSNTQLTAIVTPSLIASYGWTPVTVSNPSPGGASSQPLPLTIYTLANVPANDILFDPYTRMIYATLPSASANLLGNSVVTVDPTTGNVGTPINVGSEPNVMAETANGNILYIGLSGANRLANFSIPTQTLSATYGLSLDQSGVAATWLSVMPGTDTT